MRLSTLVTVLSKPPLIFSLISCGYNLLILHVKCFKFCEIRLEEFMQHDHMIVNFRFVPSNNTWTERKVEKLTA